MREGKMKNKAAYIQKEQKRIFALVTKKFKNYYLTGGTGLAFYFRHRFSEDLDFFSQKYDRKDPEKIMDYIAKQTGFDYQLDVEQNTPKLIPMKVYFMELKDKQVLKIDFVKDFVPNVHPIKGGLHSLDDIYYRKIHAAIGAQSKQGQSGRLMATGRQSVKDLFDLYYLSSHYKPLSDVFFEYFAYNETERLDAWYRGFNRSETKLALMDLVTRIDTGKVFKYLDDQILKRIPDKLL
ncbi:MAG: nucleotidyl transferase AbiEii/AbiGii toxin family protein [Candidatus Omnitrophica bacterium]|nr:nucleotidyl transferase AbiEii/AbiGii toxin family protein [Candidatus Omnitrophota bacterium]